MTTATTQRVKFNKTVLAAIDVPSAGRRYVYDSKVAGLCLCLTAAGTRTFYLYRKIDGRPERQRLGRFPEMTVEQARAAAVAINARIVLGENPRADQRVRREEPTVGDLCTHWIERAKTRKRTWREDQRLIGKFLGEWQTRRLGSVTRDDVERLHDRVGKAHGQYQANRLLSLIRAMFNQVARIGFTGPNVASRVERFAEQSRDRFLQPDELPRFFVALREEPAKFRDYFLTALFTGARRSNLLTMRWADIDLGSGWWRIPMTKSGEPVLVPLVEPVVQVLRSRLETRNGSEWVFPGSSESGHIEDPTYAWRRVLARAGIEDLRMHDLRRSFGSWQAITGASLPIIGKSLGHRQISTTAIYARLTLEPVRTAGETAVAAMLAAGQVVGGDDHGK